VLGTLTPGSFPERRFWTVALQIDFGVADNQGIECLREVPGSYDSPRGELGHTLTIDNR